MSLKSFISLAVLLLTPTCAMAEVKIIALFADKAMIEVEGDRKIVRKGQTFRGIKLISATGRGAEIEFEDGSRKTLGLNQTGIQSSYKPRDKKRVQIFSDHNGMFHVNGKINGKTTRFLIDTGATYIAMSESEAKKLAIDYKKGTKTSIQTANAVVPAWNTDLDSVTIGQIKLHNVDAVVLPGDQPSMTLLGMSFLKHLKLQRDGSAMIIEKKY